jgi:hypothetical protein
MIKKLRNQPYAPKWEQAPKCGARGGKTIVACFNAPLNRLKRTKLHRLFPSFGTKNVVDQPINFNVG